MAGPTTRRPQLARRLRTAGLLGSHVDRRIVMGSLLACLIIAASLANAPAATSAAAYCYQGRTTGYVRTEHGSHTYDGTPIWTSEAIVAAGWDIPIDSLVFVEDLGTFRVADRGMLGPGHIDVAVWTRSEAFAITGVRLICVTPPWEAVHE